MADAELTEAGPAQTLAERATDIIRRSILDLALPPGLRVDETLLMRRFGISRTPAREALNRLAAEDLVRIEPNRGATIAALDLGEISAFFDAYLIAERLTAHFCRMTPALAETLTAVNARLATSLSTNDVAGIETHNGAFHGALIEATENRFFIRFSLDIQNHARRTIQLVYRLEEGRGVDTADTHRAILDDHAAIIACVAAGDRAGLEQRMCDHAERFHARVVAALAPAQGRSFQLD